MVRVRTVTRGGPCFIPDGEDLEVSVGVMCCSYDVSYQVPGMPVSDPRI